jgi:hypothetical protein
MFFAPQICAALRWQKQHLPASATPCLMAPLKQLGPLGSAEETRKVDAQRLACVW